MKRLVLMLFPMVLLIFITTGCGTTTQPIVTSTVAQTQLSPAPTIWPLTPTPLPPGRIITVNSTADSSTGTLRQAILDAQPGDTITFDPAVFPPDAPDIISITSCLPGITQGNLTIDGSNAGVILDGTNLGDDWCAGIDIMSNRNIVRGLKIENFLPGAGIVISGGAQFNIIGGDRNIGSCPIGQGNQVVLSGVGIGLWGQNTSFNVVMGNLLGTDINRTSSLGNNNGLVVREGSRNNILGPDNLIAFNNENGINVMHSDSIGNTILHNSIHDNEWQGIELLEGGNSVVAPPFIFEFDLEKGTISGTTCPNCMVDIYSDRGDEGEIYEGQISADSLGAFTYFKGANFTGPYLTTTTTDLVGNSSQFSKPTKGLSETAALQIGNPLPRFHFQTIPSYELEDNRIGDMYALRFDGETPSQFVDRANNFGYKWMRISLDVFDWSEVVSGVGHYSRNEISLEQDEAITLLAQNNIKILYTIVYWDETLGNPAKGHPRFAAQDEINRYLDYVRFLVKNLKDRVEYWEILNEPNFADDSDSQQNIRVDDYIELVRQTVPVIRAEYPQAKIVVGGTSLSDPEWRPYLFAILESDIMPLVDAVSWHAGPRYTPAYPETQEYYYGYPSLVQQIKETATASGFTGEFIAAELSAWQHNDSECNPCYPWTHGSIDGAKYLARGLIKSLGMDLMTGTADHLEGEYRKQVIRNIATIMAGANPINLNVEIQSEATYLVSYAFSLSNGDQLFTLWSDGMAVDGDTPGVITTLILPGILAQKVIGIDVLDGFAQELIIENNNGDLVIRNLLVKDYPLILRLIQE